MMEFTAPHIGGSLKRGRTGLFSTPHTKRPTDKKIIAIALTGLTGTQQSTDLITATFPCTIQGIRWSLTWEQAGGTAAAVFNGAIIILRDGLTLPTLATTDGATFYSPEQDCIVFFTGIIDNNTQTKYYSGTTKSMRKIMGGDKIVFITTGAATNTTDCRGAIQFFCKS